MAGGCMMLHPPHTRGVVLPLLHTGVDFSILVLSPNSVTIEAKLVLFA